MSERHYYAPRLWLWKVMLDTEAIGFRSPVVYVVAPNVKSATDEATAVLREAWKADASSYRALAVEALHQVNGIAPLGAPVGESEDATGGGK